MRCDQFMGLPIEAEAFLEANQVVKICSECGHRTLPSEVIGHYEGVFENEYPLSRRPLQDGGYADEFHQGTVWSSGPMLFLGLRVYDTNGVLIQTFEWSEEEIENA